MSAASAVVPHLENDLSEVLRYAERGWRVLPCRPREKVPLIAKWTTAASSDPAVIRRWAKKYPSCNWGCATGSASSAWVLDIDGPEGERCLAELEALHGALPPTLISISGRDGGGRHLWFQTDGYAIKSVADILGNNSHIDVRGDGGQVVIPPSVHPTGRTYRWVDPGAEIAAAPDWLLDLVTGSGTLATPATEPVGMDDSPFGEPIYEPGRNTALHRYGCTLIRQSQSEAAIAAALAAMNDARCTPPLPDDEVRTIARSIVKNYDPTRDPLTAAWRAAQAKLRGDASRYEQLIELARQLQRIRGEENIFLPVHRVDKLLGCQYSHVSQLRKMAVKEGWLVPTANWIPHVKAGEYQFRERTGAA